jgi:hypothetical protein
VIDDRLEAQPDPGVAGQVLVRAGVGATGGYRVGVALDRQLALEDRLVTVDADGSTCWVDRCSIAVMASLLCHIESVSRVCLHDPTRRRNVTDG